MFLAQKIVGKKTYNCLLGMAVDVEFTKKIIVGGALAYATYTVVFCPCKPLFKCHWYEFWISMTVAGVTIAFV